MKITREFYKSNLKNYVPVEVPAELKLEILKDVENNVAIYFTGKKAKPTDHIRYDSPEKLESEIQKRIVEVRDRIAQNLAWKAERKAKGESIIADIKVGDVFNYSWGWEQTQQDFFQVVEKKTAKTMVVRAITCTSIDQNSSMSDYVRANIDGFCGEPETVRLNTYGGFKRSCGTANKVDNPESSKHYRSWYA